MVKCKSKMVACTGFFSESNSGFSDPESGLNNGISEKIEKKEKKSGFFRKKFA